MYCPSVVERTLAADASSDPFECVVALEEESLPPVGDVDAMTARWLRPASFDDDLAVSGLFVAAADQSFSPVIPW